MRLLVVLLFLLSDAIFCQAQNILVICTPGTAKSTRFTTGDNVGVKLKDENKAYKGIIKQISDSSFILTVEGEEKEILIPEVVLFIDYEKYWGIKLISKVSLRAGVGFFLIDTFNRTINNESPIVAERTVKASFVITSIGIILIPLTRKYYRIGEKRTLKILDFT